MQRKLGLGPKLAPLQRKLVNGTGDAKPLCQCNGKTPERDLEDIRRFAKRGTAKALTESSTV
jgi:hypothetical protein